MDSNHQRASYGRGSRPNLFDPDRPFDLNAYMMSDRKDMPPANYAAQSPSDYSSATPGSIGFSLDPSQANQQTQQPGSNAQTDPPPAWADLKTKAGKDRKRLPLACIACRRKKIRCSGEKPACKHCLKSRIPCVYKVTTRKAAPRTDYMAMLDKRLKRMEDRVIKAIPKTEEKPNIPRAILKPDAAKQGHAATARKRSAAEAFGNQLNDWSQSIGGPTVIGDRNPVDKSEEQETERLLTEGRDSLPSKEIQDHLLEIYFDYVYGQSYVLLHRPSFMRSYSSGKVPPVLLLAICAVSARFSDHPKLKCEPAFLQGEEFAEAASRIAMKRYDTPSVVMMLVYMLLGLHGLGACQGGRSWMLGGMAHRMGYALQLHKDLGYDPIGAASNNGKKTKLPFVEREMRRRLMWSCFIMDRFNSSGVERPMFASPLNLHLQLPIKEEMFILEIPGATEYLCPNIERLVQRSIEIGEAVEEVHSTPANMGVAAYFIRALVLWGDWIQYLNLGGRQLDPLGHTAWHKDSQWHKLYRELEEFQAKLPSDLVWNQENLHSHAAERIANQYLLMHITLNMVPLIANRFSYPAIAATRPTDDTPPEFLTSGRRRALEAATNISKIIADAAEHRLVAPFSGYAAYMSGCVHVHGVFSGNPQLELQSKHLLTSNIKFLTRMKKYWGTFHFLTENLKELYRQFADASAKGRSVINEGKIGSRMPPQYGDWIDKYPRGVSKTDFEEPVKDAAKSESSTAINQKDDLQTVEEFFASVASSPPPVRPQKATAKGRNTKSGTRNTPLKSQTSTDSHQDTQQTAYSYPDPFSNMNPHSQAKNSKNVIQASSPQPHASPASTSFSNTSAQQSTQPFTNQSNQFMDPSHFFQPQQNSNMGPDTMWDMNFAGLGDDWLGPAGASDPSHTSTAWFMPWNLDMNGVQDFNASGLSGDAMAGLAFDPGQGLFAGLGPGLGEDENRRGSS